MARTEMLEARSQKPGVRSKNPESLIAASVQIADMLTFGHSDYWLLFSRQLNHSLPSLLSFTLANNVLVAGHCRLPTTDCRPVHQR